MLGFWENSSSRVISSVGFFANSSSRAIVFSVSVFSEASCDWSICRFFCLFGSLFSFYGWFLGLSICWGDLKGVASYFVYN